MNGQQLNNLNGQFMTGESFLEHVMQQSSTNPTGNINLNNTYKVYNAIDGTLPQDYTTLSQVQTLTNKSLNTISTTTPNTGDVSMNNFKLTGLSAGSSTNDSVRYDQIQGVNSNVNRLQDSAIGPVTQVLANGSNVQITRGVGLPSILTIEEANTTGNKQVSGSYTQETQGDNSLPNQFDHNGNRATNNTFDITNFNINQNKTVGVDAIANLTLGLSDDTSKLAFGAGYIATNPVGNQYFVFIQNQGTNAEVMAFSPGAIGAADNALYMLADVVAGTGVRNTFTRKTGTTLDQTLYVPEDKEFVTKEYLSAGGIQDRIQDNNVTPNNVLSVDATRFSIDYVNGNTEIWEDQTTRIYKFNDTAVWQVLYQGDQMEYDNVNIGIYTMRTNNSLQIGSSDKSLYFRTAANPDVNGNEILFDGRVAYVDSITPDNTYITQDNQLASKLYVDNASTPQDRIQDNNVTPNNVLSVDATRFSIDYVNASQETWEDQTTRVLKTNTTDVWQQLYSGDMMQYSSPAPGIYQMLTNNGLILGSNSPYVYFRPSGNPDVNGNTVNFQGRPAYYDTITPDATYITQDNQFASKLYVDNAAGGTSQLIANTTQSADQFVSAATLNTIEIKTSPAQVSTTVISTGTINNELNIDNNAGITLKTVNAQLAILSSNDIQITNAELSMGSNKITNTADPTAAQDVATKNYVDTNSGGGFSNMIILSGSGNWVITAQSFKVTATGGGQGGNSSASNAVASGGSGSTAIKYYTGQTVGNTIAYSVGAGSAGGTSGSGGLQGGTTTFGTISCPGGVLWSSAAVVATGGDINLYGANGYPSEPNGQGAREGAPSYWGPGGRSIQYTSTSNGNPGLAYGSGGSGGIGSGGSPPPYTVGGNGANGVIVIEY